MTKCAIIARVSTPGQADNTSPAGQIERCKAYAASNNLTVVTEAVEVESGGLILARAYNPSSPVYHALRMAERGEIDCVVFDIADRIGRGDVIPVFEFLFRQAGADVHYAQATDTSTLSGFIAHSAQSLISGVERINIKTRMSTGRVNAVRRGQLLGTGSKAPYGYTYEREFDEVGRRLSTRLVPVASERETWMRMYRMVMDDNMALAKVARVLTDEGVPPPSRTHAQRKPLPEGGKHVGWGYSTVRSILTSPVYGGRWYYGREETRMIDTERGSKSRVVRKRKLSEIPYVEIEGFIAWHKWEALQEHLKTRNAQFIRNTKRDYLLRGLVRCTTCGHIMTGKSHEAAKGNIQRYYACTRDWQGHARCTARPVSANDIDEQVWQVVAGWLLDDANLAEGLEDADDDAALLPLQSALSALEAQRVQLAAETKRIVRAYAKRLNNVTLAALEDEQARIESEMNHIDSQIEDVKRDIHALHDAARQRERAGEVMEELRQAFADTTDVTITMRRKWLRDIGLLAVWDAPHDTLAISSLLGEATIISRRYATRGKGKGKA
jgi:site-specific DNA recombinase